MEAIDVFFSGTPRQFADMVNSLVGSRYFLKLARSSSTWQAKSRQRADQGTNARRHTTRPRRVPGQKCIATIEAHTVPAGACVTLRPGLNREHYPVALRWWEVLLARLRFEGWQVWTAGEPAQVEHDEDAPKIQTPENDACGIPEPFLTSTP